MHTWVYGKVEPGWYIAKWTWDEKWADNLKSKGYSVTNNIRDTMLHPDGNLAN